MTAPDLGAGGCVRGAGRRWPCMRLWHSQRAAQVWRGRAMGAHWDACEPWAGKSRHAATSLPPAGLGRALPAGRCREAPPQPCDHGVWRMADARRARADGPRRGALGRAVRCGPPSKLRGRRLLTWWGSLIARGVGVGGGGGGVGVGGGGGGMGLGGIGQVGDAGDVALYNATAGRGGASGPQAWRVLAGCVLAGALAHRRRGGRCGAACSRWRRWQAPVRWG